MAAPTNLLSLIVIGICCSAAVQGGETSDQMGQCTKAGLTRSYSIRSITIDSNGKKYIHYVPNEREVNQTITWVTRASVTGTDACAKEANKAGAAMFRFMGQSCSTSSDAYSEICDNSCNGRVEAKPDLSVYTLKHCQATTPATATTTAATTPAATTLAPTTTPAAATTTTLISSGGVIIAGGFNGTIMSDVEAFDTRTLPNLPNPTKGLSLSLIGAEIFACGGRTGSGRSNKCYSINISSNAASWNSLSKDIPVSISDHTASVIGSHIWLLYYNALYDLDSSTKKFTTWSLPFVITVTKCAVSNGTHAYVIGVGKRGDEIWINTEASNPVKWHQVATMAAERIYHGCLWIKGNIFITGGSFTRRDVDVIDTATNSLQTIGSLIDGRFAHDMLVLNGEPAVIGGSSVSGYLDSIETYNSATGQWTKNNRTLKHARNIFGLVQLQE